VLFAMVEGGQITEGFVAADTQTIPGLADPLAIERRVRKKSRRARLPLGRLIQTDAVGVEGHRRRPIGEDLRIESLKNSGLRFRNEMEVGPGGRQILLEDPDGNPIELFEPAR
jgi:hypothetical protein